MQRGGSKCGVKPHGKEPSVYAFFSVEMTPERLNWVLH
jgi:hypothetical protein